MSQGVPFRFANPTMYGAIHSGIRCMPGGCRLFCFWVAVRCGGGGNESCRRGCHSGCQSYDVWCDTSGIYDAYQVAVVFLCDDEME